MARLTAEPLGGRRHRRAHAMRRRRPDMARRRRRRRGCGRSRGRAPVPLARRTAARRRAVDAVVSARTDDVEGRAGLIVYRRAHPGEDLHPRAEPRNLAVDGGYFGRQYETCCGKSSRPDRAFTTNPGRRTGIWRNARASSLANRAPTSWTAHRRFSPRLPTVRRGQVIAVLELATALLLNHTRSG